MLVGNAWGQHKNVAKTIPNGETIIGVILTQRNNLKIINDMREYEEDSDHYFLMMNIKLINTGKFIIRKYKNTQKIKH